MLRDMVMNRVIKVILMLLVVFPVLVWANEYSDKLIEHYKWIANDYVVKEKKGVRKYQQMSITVRDSDKQFVYCVEPGMSINKNTVYIGSDYNQAYIANISEDEWNLINLIAYYGYGYKDSNIDHTGLKWYSITQYMIWQVAPNGYDIYFTDKLDGKRIVKYSKEIEEINNLISIHNLKPNFNISNINIDINEELEIKDNNLVLDDWKIVNNDSLDIKINNNNLIIKPKRVGNYNIKLYKEDENNVNPPIIYYSDNSQNVMRVGKFNRLNFSLDVIVSGGKLAIKKIDYDSKNIIAREGIKFKIKNIDTNKYLSFNNSDIFMTNKDGIVIVPVNLDYGNYEIEEANQLLDGYLWNKDKIKFKIDENTKYINDNTYGLIYEVNFENKIVKGKVIVNKLGEDYEFKDNMIKYYFKELDNIKFGLFANEDIYDENNNLIYEKDKLIKEDITNKDGLVIFDNLYLGKYYVKEISSIDKYIKDNNKYSFELVYKDQYTDIVEYKLDVKNYLKKGKLELIKTDLDDGNLIPNTKFNIYSNNDELIYNGITNQDGKIEISDLPVGKYYILEKLAAPGYEIDNNKYFFEINNNKITKENITNKKMIVEVPDTMKNSYFDVFFKIIFVSCLLIYVKKIY